MQRTLYLLILLLILTCISFSLFAAENCDYSIGTESDKWVIEKLTVDGDEYDIKALLGETIGSDNWSLFETWFNETFPESKLDATFNPSGIAIINITSSPYIFQTILAPELSVDPVDFTVSNCSDAGGTCGSGSGNITGIISVDSLGEYSPEYSTDADMSADGKNVSFGRSGQVWLYNKDLGYSEFIDGSDGDQSSISGDGKILAYNKGGSLIIRDIVSGDILHYLGSGYSDIHLSHDGSYFAGIKDMSAIVIRLSDMTTLDLGTASHISLSPNAQYVAFQTLTPSVVRCNITTFDKNSCGFEQMNASNPIVANDSSLIFDLSGELTYSDSSDSYTVIAANTQNHNLSADGSFVVFFTREQLATTDINEFGDVYIYEVETQKIEHISLYNGVQSDDQIGDKSRIAISGDGAFVAMHGHNSSWFGNTENDAQVFYFSNPLVCTPDETPVCGDTKRHKTEQCDDGNLDDEDGCSAICEIEFPKLQTCSWTPAEYDVASPLSKIGKYGEWQDFNKYWSYELPVEIGVWDITPDTELDQVALGYYDSSAIGTVSKVRVTMKYISSDGNTTDVEKMNPFLMDTSGNIVDTYYVPLTSSLGGLQSIDSSFQFLNLDDKRDDSASFIFELYLPTPHTSYDLVLGLGLDDGDDATQNVVYGIQNIELEGVSCHINTPPILSLLGISPLNLEVKNFYTDAGATATDTEDGDITANIIQSGSVDTNTLGSYILTYDVQDSLGLAAIPVTRTVNVVDTTKPMITLSGSSVVSVYKNTSYSDAGANWTDNNDGGGILIASGTVDTSTLGTYTLSFDVQDSSGNKAEQVTRIIHVIAGGTPGITLTGTSPYTHEVGTPYTDLGATWMDSEDGSGSLTASGSVNINQLGTYTITYSVTDSHGNVATPVTRTIHVVDTQSPTITNPNLSPLKIIVGQTLNLQIVTCADNISCTITQSGTIDVNTVGSYMITYTATDTSGNTTIQTQMVEVQPAHYAGGGTLSRGGLLNSNSSSSSGGNNTQPVTPTPTEPTPVIPSETVTPEVSPNTQDIPEITNTPSEIVENDGYMQREVNGKDVTYTLENTYKGCSIIDALNNPNYNYIKNIFPDTNTSRYPNMVDTFGTLKIVHGNINGLFEPRREITRAEFTKMVLISHCYEYQNEDTKERPYTDLEDATWEAGVVSKAQKLGIIIGFADGTFKPEQVITKAEATKILMRMAQVQTNILETTGYSDVSVEWHKKYVQIGETLGVFVATEDAQNFRPNQSVTREEMTDMIHRVVDLYR